MDDFERHKSRVYILTDEAGRVLRLEGEYSLPADLTGWTLIEEGEPCDRLNLAQSHYLDGPLFTHDGLYRYKLVDGAVVERSEEELEAEREELPEPETAPEENAALKAQLASLQDTVDTLVLDVLG